MINNVVYTSIKIIIINLNKIFFQLNIDNPIILNKLY